MDEYGCSFPRCRQKMVVILGYADDIQLCENHHLQYCDIELAEDPTVDQIVKHEKAMLRYQIKCGSRTAKRSLAKMELDLDNYQMRFVGSGKTVAEHRVARAAVVVEAEEPDDEDEFGDIGDYL